jgi:hypothetical protein
MIGNGVQSAFRNTVKSFLFVLACWTWSEFYRNFVDLEQWKTTDGSYLTPAFTKSDVKLATRACNLIAAAFKRTRDDMIRLASNPIVLEILEVVPPLSLLSEKSSLFQSEWIGRVDSLLISLLSDVESSHSSEGFILSQPLVASVTSVESGEKRTVIVERPATSVKLGKNAARKAKRKQGVSGVRDQEVGSSSSVVGSSGVGGGF